MMPSADIVTTILSSFLSLCTRMMPLVCSHSDSIVVGAAALPEGTWLLPISIRNNF
jgi:hypothetical protein